MILQLVPKMDYYTGILNLLFESEVLSSVEELDSFLCVLESSLQDKLFSLKRLMDDAATEGERAAAKAAYQRVNAKLASEGEKYTDYE